MRNVALEKNGLRDSGLKVVGKVPWGTHFCQFYQTQNDLLDVLIPYFKKGLKNNEFCVWVTSEFLTKEEAIKALKKSIPEFSKYLKNGQIEIFPYTDWYLKEGKFELKRVLNMWLAKYKQAKASGFTGLRVSGNPFWIDNKKDWNDFSAYEAEINNVIGPYQLLVLCTYSLEKCHASEIIDVVKNHKFALIKRSNKWELIESAEQKKVREELRASDEFNKSLLTALPFGIDIADQKGNVLFMSKKFLSIFGSKSLGKKCWNLYKDNKKQCTNCPLHKPIKIGETNVIESEECMEGKTMLISHTGMMYKGKPAILEVFTDITARKALEEQQRNLLTIVSHEIKNPLTPIILSLDILKKKKIEDQSIKHALEMIGRQTEKISDLLKDLLDLSSLENGKIRLNKKRVNLSSLVDNSAETVKPLIEGTKQRLKISIPKERVFISTDPLRFEQILTNLLTNASKYSKEKSSIKLSVEKNGESIYIKVKDNGIGISKDSLSNIFDLFVRGDQLSNSKKDGLGIGLFLSRELVKLHGWELQATSKGKGQGSEFAIKIPVRA